MAPEGTHGGQAGHGCRLRRGGHPNLRLHDLRHGAASRLSDRGMDVLRIAAITGHSSLRTLKRHTHFRTEDLADELGGKGRGAD